MNVKAALRTLVEGEPQPAHYPPPTVVTNRAALKPGQVVAYVAHFGGFIGQVGRDPETGALRAVGGWDCGTDAGGEPVDIFDSEIERGEWMILHNGPVNWR